MIYNYELKMYDGFGNAAISYRCRIFARFFAIKHVVY